MVLAGKIQRDQAWKAWVEDSKCPRSSDQIRGTLAPLYATTRLPRTSLQYFKQRHQKKRIASSNMSDFEDDMDVDAPAVQDSVLFSSDNTNSKGKRSIANLPVEAEDTLPW
jgi:hypothetical protein